MSESSDTTAPDLRPPPDARRVGISEAMLANADTIADPRGKTPGWVEIESREDAPLDLSGWSLSGEGGPGGVRKWAFPAVVLGPGERRLVWLAKGETTETAWYTGFDLPRSGGVLVVTRPDGTEAERLSSGPLRAGISVGNDGSGGRVWSDRPTPGAPGGAAFAGLCDPPVPSRPSGWFEGAATLSWSAVEGSVARCEVGGAAPGPQSPPCEAAIATEALVVRATSFREGWLPSDPVTVTLLPGPAKPIPVVALAVDPVAMFDPTVGLYSAGPGADPTDHFNGANFKSKRELPIHAEIFETDGSVILSADAGLRIAGGNSRTYPQKSMRIVFREKYGPKSIPVPLLQGLPYDEVDTLILRGMTDPTGYVRAADLVTSELAEGVGLDHQGWRTVAVFVNGAYRGMHALRDRIDEEFVAARYPVDPETIDLLWGNETLEAGSADAWAALDRYVRTHDLRQEDAYAEVAGKVDIGNLLDYLLLVIYAGNRDNGNIRYWRAPDRPWRWIVYDFDASLTRADHDGFAFVLDPRGTGAHQKFRTTLPCAVLDNPKARTYLASRTEEWLAGPLSPASVLAALARVDEAMMPELPAHTRRWGGSVAGWKAQLYRMRETARLRPATLRGHLARYLERAERYDEGCVP